MTTLSQTSIATTILHTSARVRHTLRAFAHGAFCVLALGCVAGCDEEPYDIDSDASEFRDGDPFGGVGEPRRLWGPCEKLNRFDEWECSGDVGIGLACLRPVSDDDLNICAPQTADVFVDDDCGNVYEPDYGLGVRLQGSAYCVIDCVRDSDCAAGQKCSPTSHFCAWVG